MPWAQYLLENGAIELPTSTVLGIGLTTFTIMMAMLSLFFVSLRISKHYQEEDRLNFQSLSLYQF